MNIGTSLSMPIFLVWRKLFILFGCCLSLLAGLAQNQQVNYSEAWAKIDSLIDQKGLTQSALAEVNKLYVLAKKNNTEVQLVKALIYKMHLEEKQQDNSIQKEVVLLEKEIHTASITARSILTSMLAETYHQYLNRHRFQLYNRTTTIDYTHQDIATWSIRDFQTKISALFLSSLKDEKPLQQARLESYDAIIIKGNARKLRPTLYDLLAHCALDYFKLAETDPNKASDAFEIDNPIAFADKNVFAEYRLVTTDSSSLHFKALGIFQKLLQFHMHDGRPDALIDADIERIVFVNQFGSMEDKDDLYMAALNRITEHFPEEPAVSRAWYLLASKYAFAATQYDPFRDTADRYAYLKALVICKKIIAQQDSSQAKSDCQNLLTEILSRSFDLKTEKVNLPDQPFRVLVTYRNLKKLYIRLISIDHRMKENLGDDSWKDEYWKKITQWPVFRTYAQSLPQTEDLQTHRVEIKIDSLPVGSYALLASANDSFDLEKNPLAVEFLYLSNIALINKGDDYFVLQRETGQPLARADVQAWYQHYNAAQNKWLERQGEHLLTDKNGYFTIHPSKITTDNRMLLELHAASDRLFVDDDAHFSTYIRPENEDEKNMEKENYERHYRKTFFFTDRSIYRPGQTVYFKGIMVTKDFNTKAYKILPEVSSTIFLYNANTQKIDSLTLITGAFGSFNGKFNIPSGLLNGSFSLKDNQTGTQYRFRVEEYKRPNFAITFEKVKESYRLQDTVRVIGAAQSFSGNTISGAKIKYRVIRQSPYPIQGKHQYVRFPIPGVQEIIHGETKTNLEGKFDIHFLAQGSKKIIKEWDPIFEFRVFAELTDITGETHNSEISIPISYHAMQLSIEVPDGTAFPAAGFNSLQVKSTNLSGEYEPAKINIVFYALKVPDRLIRESYWQAPDLFLMSKKEYTHYFPHDPYGDEMDKDRWEKTGKIYESSETVLEQSPLAIRNPGFLPGWYQIEAETIDRYGQKVRDVKDILLYNDKTGDPGFPEYNWNLSKNQILEPGGVALLVAGSSARNVHVIQELDKPNQEPDLENRYRFMDIDQERKSLVIPVNESERGGFSVFQIFVKDNRVYLNSQRITVPWTNKEVNLTYESFRDKTLPGSAEQWKIKISGSKQEKVSGELLTAMYDASLDQFTPNHWLSPDLFPDYFPRHHWDLLDNFSVATSRVKINPNSETMGAITEYDRLITSPHFKLNEQNESSFLRKMDLKTNQLTVDRELFISQAPAGHRDAIPDNIAIKKFFDPPIQIRKNLSETGFFFPQLQTDSSGGVEFSFTMPESLTRWKWMSFVHSKELAFGYSEKFITTQKELMVQPALPRFLREGDHPVLAVKIVNMGDSELTGQITLELIDPTNNQSADGAFQNMQANQYFTVAAGQSIAAGFPIYVPEQFDHPLTYRITARAIKKGGKELSAVEGAGFSDGEEATLPVLSNRLLMTETLPFSIKEGQTQNFTMQQLLKSGQSETLDPFALTVEYSSNPAWYALQSLPYLIASPYECADQLFNRFYANALSFVITNQSPHLQQVIAGWNRPNDSSLESNLQKNQDLKSVLLEETPWVIQAGEESKQKKNIALLFDQERMKGELTSSLSQIEQIQKPGGAFPWFTGGPDDRFISQYILTGLGRLSKMNALPASLSDKIHTMIESGLTFLDGQIREDEYARKGTGKKPSLGPVQIQYLYMRSFFGEYPIAAEDLAQVSVFRKLSQQAWLEQSPYLQGMIALSLYRAGDQQKAKDILASLKQNAIQDQSNGFYWKGSDDGYYWWQAKVETQALLIEAFTEISNDQPFVNELKIALLKLKQTENWKTSKATADACYAILSHGVDWLSGSAEVQIKLGEKIIRSEDQPQEAGTGYFRKTFPKDQINATMGNITVSSSPSPTGKGQPGWGAVYWQYFQVMDKINQTGGPLGLIKQLFLVKNTNRGPVLEKLSEHSPLKPGDAIKVRIELRIDRDLQYVHMKDMRASCMEPVQVLSAYQWQGGLGFYQSVKDASVNFFFDYIQKGTYVFEYPLVVTQAGSFSNGLTTVQCMYAPEFSAHSESVRVNVEPSP
jgi:Bacterial Alpha-2-macroglobulin MG10 domain/Alpha-2-macroglobulin family/MG2 domain